MICVFSCQQTIIVRVLILTIMFFLLNLRGSFVFRYNLSFLFALSELELKYHGCRFVSASAWKRSVNAATEGVGMLPSSRVLTSLNRMEKIQLKTIINGKISTTITSCYNPTIASAETDIISITRYLPLSDWFQKTTFWVLIQTWKLK